MNNFLTMASIGGCMKQGCLENTLIERKQNEFQIEEIRPLK